MVEVRKHNAALMEKLEALSNRAIEAVETTRKPDGDPFEIINIRQAIADLETRKEDAVENLKGKEVVQIDRELHKLERIVEGYEYSKRQETEEKKREKAQPKPKPTQEAEVDPILDEFTKDNDWFNKDPIMTGAALEYDRFLLAKPEWKGKPDKERFRQVRTDIESRFNAKTEPKSKPVGAESGLGLQRPAGLTSAKTVKLSSEEMAVAQGLGISAESYAKQKNFLGGAV
jgi:hypothetical protein